MSQQILLKVYSSLLTVTVTQSYSAAVGYTVISVKNICMVAPGPLNTTGPWILSSHLRLSLVQTSFSGFNWTSYYWSFHSKVGVTSVCLSAVAGQNEWHGWLRTAHKIQCNTS
jgi:hypothetical protein